MFTTKLPPKPTPKSLPNSNKEAKEKIVKEEETRYFIKDSGEKPPSASNIGQQFEPYAINVSDDEDDKGDEKNSPLNKSSGEITITKAEKEARQKKLPEINLEKLGLSNEVVTESSQRILKYLEGGNDFAGFFIANQQPDNNVLKAISTILGKVSTIIDREEQYPRAISALAFAFHNSFKTDCDTAQCFSEAAFDEKNIGIIQEKFNKEIAKHKHKSKEDKNVISDLEAKFEISFINELGILMKDEQPKSSIENPKSEVEISGLEQAELFENCGMRLLGNDPNIRQLIDKLFGKLFGKFEPAEDKQQAKNYSNLYNIISIIPYKKMPKANLETTMQVNTKEHLALKNYLINTLKMNEQYIDDFIFACLSTHKQDNYASMFGQKIQHAIKTQLRVFRKDLLLFTADDIANLTSLTQTKPKLAKDIQNFIDSVYEIKEEKIAGFNKSDK